MHTERIQKNDYKFISGNKKTFVKLSLAAPKTLIYKNDIIFIQKTSNEFVIDIYMKFIAIL